MAITADTRPAPTGLIVRCRTFVRRNPTIVLGAAMLAFMTVVAISAP